MSELVLNVLLPPLVYGSGLLLWPLRRLLHRNQKAPGRGLGLVFLLQIAAYLVLACCCLVIRLQHFYDWFVVLMGLNFLFTVAGAFVWIRDDSRQSKEAANRGA